MFALFRYELSTANNRARSARLSPGAFSQALQTLMHMVRLFFQGACLLLTASLLAGCRSRVSTELLEREIRARDRRIYELEYELEKNSGLVFEAPAAARTTTERAREVLPVPPPANRRRPGQRLLDLLNNDLAPAPGDELPEGAGGNLNDQGGEAGAGAEGGGDVEGGLEKTELPDASPEDPGMVGPGENPDPVPNVDQPETQGPHVPPDKDVELGPPEGADSSSGAQQEAAPDLFQTMPASYSQPSDLVETVQLVGFLCHGRFDGGDESPALYVVFEMLDKQGKRMVSPGDVSIRVFDVTAEQSPLGRANFPASRVERASEQTALGRQFRLVLPLAQKPRGNQLKIEMAFAAADGRLLSDAVVAEYVLPGRFATRPLDKKRIVSKGEQTRSAKDGPQASKLRRAGNAPRRTFASDQGTEGPDPEGSLPAPQDGKTIHDTANAAVSSQAMKSIRPPQKETSVVPSWKPTRD